MRSGNPYFLYAASNLGSFGALLGYVAAIEPNLARGSQLGLLHGLMAVFVGLFGLAAAKLYRRNPLPARQREETPPAAITRGQVARWLALSFVPSSLLYGVTLYITTDVAAIPLLWVIPLSLYLLTFVLVFADKPIGLAATRCMHLPVAAAILLFYHIGVWYNVKVMLLHLAAFFIIAMGCHGQLSRQRPHASQLTAFYLWVSLGGVLAGLFNIFVAPLLFITVGEYPLMIFLSAVVVMPWGRLRAAGRAQLRREVLVPAAWVLGVFGVLYLLQREADLIGAWSERDPGFVRDYLFGVAKELLRVGVIVMACYCVERFRLVSATLFLSIMGGYYLNSSLYPDRAYLFEHRNLFGVSRVFHVPELNVNMYRHGTTEHGKQSLDEAHRLEPVAYYGPPLTMLFAAVREQQALAALPVGAVGLGVGTVACQGAAGQEMDFFEIDDVVKQIAYDEKLYSYMRDCPPEKKVIIGDGRLNLERQPDGRYGVLLFDAFSSDAIPVHILTLEAVQMYQRKLAEGGVLAFHVTNRHLDMLPVLGAISAKLGVPAYVLNNRPPEDNRLLDFSQWVVMTGNEAIFERLRAQDGGWNPLPETGEEFLWKDDFSNIYKTMRQQNLLWMLFE